MREAFSFVGHIHSCYNGTHNPTHPGATVATSACQGYSSGQACTLSCQSGFVGDPLALCTQSGEWMYAGSCEAAGCGIASHPSPFAAAVGNCQGTPGSICNFRCSSGYSGLPYSTCQINGQWTHTGQCERLSCGPPRHPSDFVEVCKT